MQDSFEHMQGSLRALLSKCRAHLNVCGALLRAYRALVSMCRALLNVRRALLSICRALLEFFFECMQGSFLSVCSALLDDTSTSHSKWRTRTHHTAVEPGKHHTTPQTNILNNQLNSRCAACKCRRELGNTHTHTHSHSHTHTHTRTTPAFGPHTHTHQQLKKNTRYHQNNTQTQQLLWCLHLQSACCVCIHAIPSKQHTDTTHRHNTQTHHTDTTDRHNTQTQQQHLQSA